MELPEKWKDAQKSCKDLHPDYQYRFWTDAAAEELIRTKFPWFLDTYRGYTHNIQRADAVRYFILYEFGGIYLDLDIKCVKSLDFLRYFNFTAPKTYPVGMSNDLLVSRPRDPFAERLIRNLRYWNRWFFVKYATVMFSTGPMFVTIQYALHGHKDEVTMLPADIYGKYKKTSAAYMVHLHGSSWHGNDARLVFWLEHNWVYLVTLGVSSALLLIAWLVRRYSMLSHAKASPGQMGVVSVPDLVSVFGGASKGAIPRNTSSKQLEQVL
eukprot:CAMPEP_0202901688 /NCGR_PEP_ID=MMETSP1392-20130828/14401_1 /ASSEMBLY_ACC=CAM_ASM_000868 /TAXON_ID=225041 /ORGANISM="Chlamydomonas chlamydogama, Strain SAG 11-48b" /LENGTH=267 /DNA_ID=CAMNT_0049588293 /DNA_START=295 /DNA_END=1098 /DNA_ORIENTATION=-